MTKIISKDFKLNFMDEEDIPFYYNPFDDKIHIETKKWNVSIGEESQNHEKIKLVYTEEYDNGTKKSLELTDIKQMFKKIKETIYVKLGNELGAIGVLGEK